MKPSRSPLFHASTWSSSTLRTAAFAVAEDSSANAACLDLAGLQRNANRAIASKVTSITRRTKVESRYLSIRISLFLFRNIKVDIDWLADIGHVQVLPFIFLDFGRWLAALCGIERFLPFVVL